MPETHLRVVTGATNIATPHKDDLSDRYPPGRHCEHPDCITILCQWNPGPWCYCHAVKHQAELREAA